MYKIGLKAQKSSKFEISGLHLALRGNSLKAILTKFDLKERTTGLLMHAEFHLYSVEMWVLGPQIIKKFGFFCTNFPLRGASLQQLLKFTTGEGVLGLLPHIKFHRYHFRNVHLLPKKSLKLVIFGINFLLRGNTECTQKCVMVICEACHGEACPMFASP